MDITWTIQPGIFLKMQRTDAFKNECIIDLNNVIIP